MPVSRAGLKVPRCSAKEKSPPASETCTVLFWSAAWGFRAIPDAVVDAASYVLCRVADAGRRDRKVGTYFRLVAEPDAQAKRAGFENALRTLRRSAQSSTGYRCRQPIVAEIDVVSPAPR